MGRLADDWDEQRQTGEYVLCAYMRMSFQKGVSQVGSQEDEVRASIVKNIAQRMVPGQEFTWVDMRIDLSGSVIKGCDFSGAVFMHEPNFYYVRFEGYNSFDGRRLRKGARSVTFVRSGRRRVGEGSTSGLLELRECVVRRCLGLRRRCD